MRCLSMASSPRLSGTEQPVLALSGPALSFCCTSVALPMAPSARPRVHVPGRHTANGNERRPLARPPGRSGVHPEHLLVRCAQVLKQPGHRHPRHRPGPACETVPRTPPQHTCDANPRTARPSDPRTQDGPAWLVRKLQLATLKPISISRNLLLVFNCGCRLRADTGSDAGGGEGARGSSEGAAMVLVVSRMIRRKL